MPGIERICSLCGYEKASEYGGQTQYHGKKWCECDVVHATGVNNG